MKTQLLNFVFRLHKLSRMQKPLRQKSTHEMTANTLKEHSWAGTRLASASICLKARSFFVHKMRTTREEKKNRKITTDIACISWNSHGKLIALGETGFSKSGARQAAKKFHCTTAKAALARNEMIYFSVSNRLLIDQRKIWTNNETLVSLQRSHKKSKLEIDWTSEWVRDNVEWTAPQIN